MNAPFHARCPSTSARPETVTLDDNSIQPGSGRAFMGGGAGSGQAAHAATPARRTSVGQKHRRLHQRLPGSPGGYDQALQKGQPYLKAQNIVFQPGVNELAATALWGTQQLGFAPPGTNKFDGVFGIWYGRAGRDRCSDVFKHANMAGTTPWAV